MGFRIVVGSDDAGYDYKERIKADLPPQLSRKHSMQIFFRYTWVLALTTLRDSRYDLHW